MCDSRTLINRHTISLCNHARALGLSHRHSHRCIQSYQSHGLLLGKRHRKYVPTLQTSLDPNRYRAMSPSSMEACAARTAPTLEADPPSGPTGCLRPTNLQVCEHTYDQACALSEGFFSLDTHVLCSLVSCHTAPLPLRRETDHEVFCNLLGQTSSDFFFGKGLFVVV